VLPDGMVMLGSMGPGGQGLLPDDLSFISVEASTNLRDWTTLPGACTVTNGALLVPDPDGVQYPLRFYRLVQY
jgi:hypothetical protein